MRDGRNPNHYNVPCPPVPGVSLCVVTHCPDDSFYHAQHFQVVRLCIDSMIRGASGKASELIIWDNGSTRDFRDMLRNRYSDYLSGGTLIESPNIGPHNARRALCAIARGKYINLSDDDILYSPDWLDKQYQIMQTYPNVAVVSGSPINIEFRRNWKPAHEFAAKNKGEVTKVTGFSFIPEQWESDWCYSIGKKPEGHKPTQQETYLEYKGIKAWAQAHHMQMLCPRDTIAPFLKPTKNLVDFWDIADEISKAGYLQLSTFERTALHIGNVIDPSIERIVREWQKR